ncbi:hypothetical protein BD410DRAFT_545619 [Rickenella mellea]|uniref:Ras-GEF domain-containing protein n=1 Tax=Rickenella mellea TaxID=50990 RepID=A0A4Y7PRD8_9AGAM|nr:hypothetical protein BD410DRAFT_545619 [Rickenella mellea]
MKDFLSTTDAAELHASKHLFDLIECAQAGGKSVVETATVSSQTVPRTIEPKLPLFRKLELLDINALEMARQLTILESRFHNKIGAVECLHRVQESSKVSESDDHITQVIEVTKKISHWVTNTILSGTDPGKRATVFEHLISVADTAYTGP